MPAVYVSNEVYAKVLKKVKDSKEIGHIATELLDKWCNEGGENNGI